jgi:hypothetical protein
MEKINIVLKVKETSIRITYDSDGYFDHVINLDTKKELMIEFCQHGKGYKFEKSSVFIPIITCEAIYIKIIDLNIYIPKFIFIDTEKDTSYPCS